MDLSRAAGTFLVVYQAWSLTCQKAHTSSVLHNLLTFAKTLTAAVFGCACRSEQGLDVESELKGTPYGRFLRSKLLSWPKLMLPRFCTCFRLLTEALAQAMSKLG